MTTTTDSGRRWRTVSLDADNLERALDDPGLAAMTADGWVVAAAVPTVDGEGDRARARLTIILHPPPAAQQASPAWRGVASTATAVALGTLPLLAALWGLLG